MTDTSSLRAFIEARLADDEEHAREVEGDGNWGYASHGLLARGGVEGPDMVEAEDDVVYHAARHDPARVLREVAAKRAILAARVEAEREYDRIDDYEHQTAWATIMGALDDVLPLLASVWSDHPDYRTSWAAT